MKLASRIASTALAGGALTASAAGMAMTGTVPASAATCATTYSYTHTASGAAYSSTWSTRRTCGTGLYQLWSHRVGRTSAGTVTDRHTYRNAWPVGHFWQRVDGQSITIKGKVSYTLTITSR